MSRLEEWYVYYKFSDTYNEKMPFIIGKIFNDDRFQDGTEIRTSYVLELRQGYCRTLNTEYILE